MNSFRILMLVLSFNEVEYGMGSLEWNHEGDRGESEHIDSLKKGFPEIEGNPRERERS